MALSSRVKSLALFCTAAFMLGGTSLQAVPINFYTTGIFSQSGTAVGTFGSLTLTFAGVGTPGTPVTVDAAPFSFTSFGTITAATAATTGQPTSGTFTLNIFQTVPSSGNGSIVGTLSGTIDVNTSQATVTVNTNSLVIGGVTYAYQSSVFALVPPTTNNGATSLQGIVTAPTTGVPEPSSMLLLGSGLLAAGFAGRRLRRS